MSTKRAGFSLVELAVVLAIIAVVAAMGIDLGQNAIRGSTRVSTQEKLALIKESLDAYAARNGYLPCPADPSQLPSSATFGFESRTTLPSVGCLGIASQVFNNGQVWYGMVPVRNLGLDDSYATDAWGGKLLYGVSASHVGAGNGLSSYAMNLGTIVIRSGTRASSVALTTVPTTGAPGAGATFVVVSFGPNQRGAYPLNASAVGFACGSDGTLIEVENCDRANEVFFDAQYNEGKQTNTMFDDYVVWGSNQTKLNPPVVLTNSCSSGCDTWCAPCENARTSTPPGSGTRVCAKFITKNSPSCEALCIWPNQTTPCP